MPRKMPDPYEPPEAFPTPGITDASELAEFIRLGRRALEAAEAGVADGEDERVRVADALHTLKLATKAAQLALQLTGERAMAARLMTQRQIADASDMSKTTVNLWRARPVTFERLHELELAVERVERGRRDGLSPESG